MSDFLTYDLNDSLSYKAYFQALATSNKLLGAGKFIYGDEAVGQGQTFSWKGMKLWAWPFERARMQDQRGDNYYFVREGSLWVGASRPEKFGDRDTLYNDCEKVIKQILSKMILDFTNNTLVTQFSSYTMQRQDMTLGGSSFVGCELVFTYDDPTGLEYNEDDWNP